MKFHGVLSDEMVSKFIRISAELCIHNCSRVSDSQNRVKCYYTIDAFVKLIYMLIKHTSDSASAANKLNLLNRTLGVIVGLMQIDQDTLGNDFYQMPYERLLIMLFQELGEPSMELLSFQVKYFAYHFYL